MEPTESVRRWQALNEVAQVITSTLDLDEVLKIICQSVVDILGYRMTWVGLVEEGTFDVKPVAEAGFEKGYLSSIKVRWDDSPLGRGPTGLAIRNRRPAFMRHIDADPTYEPWREGALKRGYYASAAFPLVVGEKVIGALNVYGSSPDAFDEEEVPILNAFANQAAIAIENARLYEEAQRELAERKRAEEALRESEEWYHDLIESAHDMIQSVAPDGRFVFVNGAWLETLGYTEAELPDLNLWTIIHPESLFHCQEIFSRVVAGESIRSVQATFLAKDGRSILVEGNVTGRYTGGKLVATHGFFRDIAERKRAEERLQRTLEKLRKALGGTIQALALTVETRDPYTAGHQRRATNLARAIATEMGLSEEQIDGIRMAGAIHDLGKISVPAGILNKPGRLNENEFGIIQAHPQVGYDILKTIEFPWPVAQIVFQHHERMDGSGYPRGLVGEEILLEARILAVADVVEAMSSHRPYRPALGIDKALEEISQNRGVLYDPEVVDACLRLFAEKGFRLE